jgi:hypothetical protein
MNDSGQRSRKRMAAGFGSVLLKADTDTSMLEVELVDHMLARIDLRIVS